MTPPAPCALCSPFECAGHPRCAYCMDTGYVCENHPRKVWSGVLDVGKACGCGAGMPCPNCCSSIPEDGTQQITMAFTPDWKRD